MSPFQHLLLVSVLLVVFSELSCGRVRYKYRKRTECREEWPRRADDLPKVVLSGVVQHTNPPSAGSMLSSANIFVKWVIKGPEQLEGTRITVDGFGRPDSCYPIPKSFDSVILLLEESTSGLYRLNGTVFRVNLNNLDRIQSVVADQAYRRRPDIPDQACESNYCPNNADCVEESDGQTRCQCPTSCSTVHEPVCGSDQETYVNECRLRADSCAKGQNVFIKHTGTCDARQRIRTMIPNYVRPNFQ